MWWIFSEFSFPKKFCHHQHWIKLLGINFQKCISLIWVVFIRVIIVLLIIQLLLPAVCNEWLWLVFCNFSSTFFLLLTIWFVLHLFPSSDWFFNEWKVARVGIVHCWMCWKLYKVVPIVWYIDDIDNHFIHSIHRPYFNFLRFLQSKLVL